MIKQRNYITNAAVSLGTAAFVMWIMTVVKRALNKYLCIIRRLLSVNRIPVPFYSTQSLRLPLTIAKASLLSSSPTMSTCPHHSTTSSKSSSERS